MLTRLLRSAITETYEFVNRCLPPRTHATAVIAPASQGSLGDQAILQGLQDGFVDREKFGELNQICLPNYQAIQLRGVQSRLTTITTSPYRDRVILSGTALSHSNLVVAGADIMDGYYNSGDVTIRCELLNRWVANGRKATLAGFSFNEKPAQEAVVALQSLDPSVRVFARDPLSLERLLANGIKAELSADLAFLMKPQIDAQAHHETIDFFERQAHASVKVIGVNLHGPLFNVDHANRANETAKAVSTFLHNNPDWSACFVPHDYRGDCSDLDALQSLLRHCDPSLSSRIHLVEKKLCAWEAKWIAQQLSLAVSGRMHFVIACLGSGVPALGASYQGKFEGLYRHFGVDDMAIQESFWSSSVNLLGAIESAVNRRKNISDSILKAIPGVRALAQQNLPTS
ncbi:polysaccharide pyruvyl transferase family protein [Gemmatimonas phototrophica]|uniref:polysaccharide pyruvyl transferase family protein n=1 Tax=Gemmatimonas phototrophica TaxID=1379270 RepID=UPI0009ED9AE0|nr:polysaccharide pyruvyl transferase family protein [Gemmatimonas phototrophica]